MAKDETLNSNQAQNEQKIHLANVLLISGDCRNIGKTTLACRIIKKLSQKMNVIAVKVSPHFHDITGSLVIIKELPSLMIARETDQSSGKDSSRFLQAGASEVLYVQCRENSFPDLARWINENLPSETPVIVESGGLKNFIIPGYAAHIKEGRGEKELSHYSDAEVIFNNFSPESVESVINWQNNKWQK